ncbi:unnamed protein product [Moneuplotes crassus]|uniref:Uncharacterized protein n=1 Tax=Euplotes crassus TaxID=5936 RepID=A0AAD1Y6X5_EUPCR|nr:unnamed protein product [Moneuplotes crassus]
MEKERQGDIPYDYDHINKARDSAGVATYTQYRMANLQYVFKYSQQAFLQGVALGSLYGTYKAFNARSIMKVPIYGVGFGVSYAAFHAVSAFFRNEI